LSEEKIKGLWIFGFVFIFMFWGLAFSQQGSSFCCLWGEVEFGGVPAEDGYEVTATIDDNVVGTATTEKGQYFLCIPKDDPQTQKKDGWSEEDVIFLKVKGQTANPPVRAFLGTREQKISVSSADAPTTTWGKIKALFK